MVFKIENTLWEIKELHQKDQSDRYIVFKNNKECTSLCAGSTYETESGACFAILNEYSID